jgi:hypothetical protein
MNGQDARSTREFICCETGILPVFGSTREFICCGTGILPVADNGATSQIKPVATIQPPN